MEQVLLEGLLDEGILGIVCAILMFFLIMVYRSKEKLIEEDIEKTKETLSVIKDLTHVVQIMNNSLLTTPSEIREKVSVDIQKSLTSIDSKMDLMLFKYGKDTR